MIDHRQLQRALFRMQLDPEFAEAVFEDPAGMAPALGPEERQILMQAPLAAIVADARGRRRAQVLGNAASEYSLSLAEASRIGIGADFLAAFPSAEEFHRAVASDRPLPLAFGTYLQGRAAAAGHGVLVALARLEEAMAVARRGLRSASRPGPGEVVLSPRAWLVSLPPTAFDHAQAVRAALDAGGDAPPPPGELERLGVAWLCDATEAAPASLSFETVLLVASERAGGDRLREVAAERLEADVACLLRAAERPLDASRLAALSAERQWTAADVGDFVNGLVAEGVLSRG